VVESRAEGEEMSRWQKEFETTSVDDLRRMVAANVFAPEKHKAAQEFLYDLDTKYPRRAFTISMFSLVTSILALLVSAYAAFWKH
jgi:hypothetical protein